MFKIYYQSLVVSDDIPKLSGEWRVKVKSAIESRLVSSPEMYGKPLRRPLNNYWKLRVGDYRIIFKIDKKIVVILMIEHRAVVYKYIMARIKRSSF